MKKFITHESAARELTRRALSMVKKGKDISSVCLNGCTHTIRINKTGKIEFWSAEKFGETNTAAGQDAIQEMFLGVLNRTMSKNHPIEFQV